MIIESLRIENFRGFKDEMIKDVLDHAICHITQKHIDITPVDIEQSITCLTI